MTRNLSPSNISIEQYTIKADFEYQVPQDTSQAAGYYYYYDYSSGNLCYAWETDRLAAMKSLPGYTYYTGWQCGLYFSGSCDLHKRGFTRFPLTNITRHTQISNFTMLVNSGPSSQTSENHIYIYAEQSDTGSAPTDEVELNNLVLGDYVEWEAPNFAPDQWYETPNLSSIVQPVIDRPGWVDYGHITIVFKCPVTSRYVRSWLGASYTNRPKINLTVEV